MERTLRTVLSATLIVAPCIGAAAQEREQASIPFATTTGIQGWRAVDNDTLYIRSRNDQWYKADLFGPCFGLEFDPTIGFVVRFGSTFDRSSSIIVEGRECKVSSLVEVDGPPSEQEQASAKASGVVEPAPAVAQSEQSPQSQSSQANAQPRRESARIPFANLGSIEDWRAVNDRLLYIEGRNNQWYRAELFGPCPGLPFETTIGFVVEPTGTFDKFSSIVVDGRECPLATLTKAEGPPSGSRRASAGN